MILLLVKRKVCFLKTSYVSIAVLFALAGAFYDMLYLMSLFRTVLCTGLANAGLPVAL